MTTHPADQAVDRIKLAIRREIQRLDELDASIAIEEVAEWLDDELAEVDELNGIDDDEIDQRVRKLLDGIDPEDINTEE